MDRSSQLCSHNITTHLDDGLFPKKKVVVLKKLIVIVAYCNSTLYNLSAHRKGEPGARGNVCSFTIGSHIMPPRHLSNVMHNRVWNN